MGSAQEEIRSVSCPEGRISYLLTRKRVKNLNLRVRADGSVAVSASNHVPAAAVDAFVLRKADFVLAALERVSRRGAQMAAPRRYETGETIRILGQALSLQVEEGRATVFSDGGRLCLRLPNPDDFVKKERLVQGFLDTCCRNIFSEIAGQIYPAFESHGVPLPVIKTRGMKTRWGSCSPSKGAITLNKSLLAAPRACIEYVVLHEFCHLVHPNHSKQFYGLVASLMPDWKERKALLEHCAAEGLL